MGGKSRKTGMTSKRLIEKITGKSCGGGSGKGKPKGSLERGGRGIFSDFSAEEVAKRKNVKTETT